MKIMLLASAVAVSLLAGCASVPLESPEKDAVAKQFNAPSAGKSGVYIYRKGGPGSALKKDIWIDDKCVGESASSVYFYEEVSAGSHKVSTESEFSPNDLMIDTAAGQNYFVNQYMKMGLFVGGANLELEDEEKAKKAISKLSLAKGGNCSK